MLIELVAAAAVGGAALYKGNKALEMDEKAAKKYSKAFTRECEAHKLVSQKRNLADKRLENVAKKKRAIINASLPMFVEIYEQIQKVNVQSRDTKFEMECCSDAEWNHTLQSVDIVTKKEFTNQELIVGIFLKSFSGMVVEDSKRNLSAANSQVRAANVVYSQAQSIAEVYDAIIARSDRVAALLMGMNALFMGILSQTQEIISANGTDVGKYSEKEKTTLMLCVNFAVAMTKLLDIPILDENGRIAEAAVEMIQTGEDYLTRMNELINE